MLYEHWFCDFCHICQFRYKSGLNKTCMLCTEHSSPRSASYRASTGECRLSDMDRHTVAGTGAFTEAVGEEYLENNCVDDPVKLCDFQLLENRIMKTVDSVYQVTLISRGIKLISLDIVLVLVFDFFNCSGCADNGGVQGSVPHCPVQVSVTSALWKI